MWIPAGGLFHQVQRGVVQRVAVSEAPCQCGMLPEVDAAEVIRPALGKAHLRRSAAQHNNVRCTQVQGPLHGDGIAPAAIEVRLARQDVPPFRHTGQGARSDHHIHPVALRRPEILGFTGSTVRQDELQLPALHGMHGLRHIERHGFRCDAALLRNSPVRYGRGRNVG